MNSMIDSEGRESEAKLLNYSSSTYVSTANNIEYNRKETNKRSTIENEQNQSESFGQQDNQLKNSEFDSGRIRSASVGSTESAGDGSDKMGTF